MVVVFAALGNGFDRRDGVVDGRFGSRMVSLVSYLQFVGLGFMNLLWMNVKEFLVMRISYMGLFLGFMGLIYRGFNVNVLEFSVLRLIMNVGRLGLS